MASQTGINQDWKQRIGQLVSGKYQLSELLGSSDHSAVFLTQHSGGARAALKLIPADSTRAEADINRLKAASRVQHPRLLRIYDAGKHELGGESYVYVVMELAEENLSQVVPERALSVAEAKPMLSAVVEALVYLHSKGLVHGGIKPGNILASGEDLKLATDRICEAQKSCPAGAADAYSAPEYGSGMSSAADIWSLGMTLVEALTRKLPSASGASDPSIPPSLPQPFFDIARHSLRRDPGQRWTAQQIADHLSSRTDKPPLPETVREPEPQPMRKRPRYVVPVLAIAALVLLLIVIAFLRRPQSQPAAPEEVTGGSESAAGRGAPKPSAAAAGPGTVPRTSTSQPNDTEVLQRVAPQVSRGALHTITGHIRVAVRAKVDASGNVTDAGFATRGPSQYFARETMNAARQWKFAAPVVDGKPVASEWLIRFSFSRRGVDDSAQRVSP